MKKIAKLIFVCMACIVMLSLNSCGSKVNKEELDKKVQQWSSSDEKPTFTADEYEFMADYLNDHFKEISDMEFDNKEGEIYMGYSFILLGAQMEGNLPPKAVEKWKKIVEKTEEANKENIKAFQEAWDEAEADRDEAVEEYTVVEE